MPAVVSSPIFVPAQDELWRVNIFRRIAAQVDKNLAKHQRSFILWR